MSTGNRSVEVIVTNDTRGDLTVTAPQAGSGSTWIQGEQPNQGDPLPQYQSAKWGVFTNDAMGNVTGQLQLIGLGNVPVTLSFYNYSNGVSGAPCLGNESVTVNVIENPVVEANHTSFTVQLVPNVQAASATFKR